MKILSLEEEKILRSVVRYLDELRLSKSVKALKNEVISEYNGLKQGDSLDLLGESLRSLSKEMSEFGSNRLRRSSTVQTELVTPKNSGRINSFLRPKSEEHNRRKESFFKEKFKDVGKIQNFPPTPKNGSPQKENHEKRRSDLRKFMSQKRREVRKQQNKDSDNIVLFKERKQPRNDPSIGIEMLEPDENIPMDTLEALSPTKEPQKGVSEGIKPFHDTVHAKQNDGAPLKESANVESVPILELASGIEKENFNNRNRHGEDQKRKVINSPNKRDLKKEHATSQPQKIADPTQRKRDMILEEPSVNEAKENTNVPKSAVKPEVLGSDIDYEYAATTLQEDFEPSMEKTTSTFDPAKEKPIDLKASKADKKEKIRKMPEGYDTPTNKSGLVHSSEPFLVETDLKNSLETFYPVCKFLDVSVPVRSFHFDKENRLLVSGTNEKMIYAHDLSSYTFPEGNESYKSLNETSHAQPDSQNIVDFTLDGLFYETLVKDLHLIGENSLVEKAHRGSIYSLDMVSGSSSLVLSASNDKVMKLWSTRKTNKGGGAEIKLLKNFKYHSSCIRKVLLGRKEQFVNKAISAAGGQNEIAVWDLLSSNPRTPLLTLQGHQDVVFDVIQGVGSTLISASDDYTLKQWDIREPTKENLRATFPVKQRVRCLSSHPIDAATVVGGTESGEVVFIDIRAQKALDVIKVHDAEIRAIEFSCNGKGVLSASFDGTVGFFWTANKSFKKFRFHQDKVLCCGWQSETSFFTSSADGTVLLWSA
eukprot:snap_masked-scaffold_4-processed-gene-3.47-mRNA-1 protein AED:1.00 eAED:1.00 QI:0/0/0/0/1/1/2/0/761